MKKNDIASLLSQLAVPLLLMVLGLVLLVNPDSASALIAKILGWGLMIGGIVSAISALTARTGLTGKVLSAIVCFALRSG